MLKLRILADLTAHRLRHRQLNRQSATALIERTREEVLELFPDKGEVFDLVLRPRFVRIVDERTMADWGTADSLN